VNGITVIGVNEPVVQVSPANGVLGVPLNVVPQIQFNKPIDSLTVNTSNFQLIPSGGNPILGTITVSSNGLTAAFVPSTPLVAETRYFIVEKYSPVSETRRAMTTVSGATKLKVHIQLITRNGRVVLDRAVEGRSGS
jgi:Big-like domain-containing protein